MIPAIAGQGRAAQERELIKLRKKTVEGQKIQVPDHSTAASMPLQCVTLA